MEEVSMSIFEKAAKQKLRFQSDRGLLTVEDLYDLPLKGKAINLDSLAKAVNRGLKAEEEESFVDTASSTNLTLNLKLDILKHVIAEKLDQESAKQALAAKKVQREQIEGALATAQQRDLLSKTPEELQELLKKL